MMANNKEVVFRTVNEYNILKEIGHDKFSKLYYIQSKQNEAFMCALKAINLSEKRLVDQVEAEDKEKLCRIAVETIEKMRLARHHPNIVRLFSCFLDGPGKLYVALEFCEGGSLYETIRQLREKHCREDERHFDERQILNWTAQLTFALKFLHRNNILHRNVTSKNIFLKGKDGQIAKLGDFGIEMSTFIGTLSHMPPEMWNEKSYTRKSEVWTFGVVVYELCALHLPVLTNFFETNFGGSAGLLKAICSLPIKPLPEMFSQSLRSLVFDKLLERNYKKRATIYEVAHDPCISDLMVAMEADYSNLLHTLSPGEVSHPFSDAAYYKDWDQTGKILLRDLKAPSDIKAILACQTDGDDDSNEVDSIVIICQKGDVIALQHNNWDTVEWQVKIGLERKDEIGHAVYDSGNDRIFLAIANRGKICSVSRHALENLAAKNFANNTSDILPCNVIVSEILSDGRIFDGGLTVDPGRRLLFACSGNRAEITIWQLLNDGESKIKASVHLIATIDFTGSNDQHFKAEEKIHPWKCAIFNARKPGSNLSQNSTIGDEIYKKLASRLKALPGDEDPGDILLLAISDFRNDRIELLSTRAKSFDEALLNRHGDDFGDLFSHAATIANNSGVNNSHNEFDSVCQPSDIQFDLIGNLIAADSAREKVKIFAFDTEPLSPLMKAVWSSKANDDGFVWRAAIAVNPKTKKPAILALNDWRKILIYD